MRKVTIVLLIGAFLATTIVGWCPHPTATNVDVQALGARTSDETNGFGDLFQTADWKTEKHVPVIELPSEVRKNESIEVTVSVGKEIPHPNTAEHHIAWIEVYFLPRGETFPYLIAKSEFSAHGESVQGPNTSTVYTEPTIRFSFRTEKSGTLYAVSYCSIHGLWVSSAELNL